MLLNFRAEGNLGSLSRLLNEPEGIRPPSTAPEILPYNGELQFNGFAIFGSTVLLLILTAILFERILGLDKLLAKYLKDIVAKRQSARRQDLERLYNESNDDND